MLDLALTREHDLDVSTLDLRLVSGADRVRQQLTIKLRLLTGEWFLDAEFGTPYLQEILGKKLTMSGALAALKKSILEVKDVIQITSFNHQFDNKTRILKVQFVVLTPFGEVEVTQ